MPTLSTCFRTAAVATALSAMLAGQVATARERQTTVSGANGKSATRQVHRSQGDVSSSTTGPNGKTASREVDRSASGATATLSGPNGRTVQRQTTVSPQ